MTTPNRFQMTWNGRSCAVVVDGHDVSDLVTSVDVQAELHDLPSVVLRLAPGKVCPASLDLLARVHVGSPDPGPAAAQFLEAMDAIEVERAALARDDLEIVPGGMTAAVLRQLTEWARGA